MHTNTGTLWPHSIPVPRGESKVDEKLNDPSLNHIISSFWVDILRCTFLDWRVDELIFNDPSWDPNSSRPIILSDLNGTDRYFDNLFIRHHFVGYKIGITNTDIHKKHYPIMEYFKLLRRVFIIFWDNFIAHAHLENPTKHLSSLRYFWYQN